MNPPHSTGLRTQTRLDPVKEAAWGVRPRTVSAAALLGVRLNDRRPAALNMTLQTPYPYADHHPPCADRAATTPQPPPLPTPYPSYNQTTRSGPSGHSPGVAREWGSNPHPTTPPPPSTRAHPACRPGLETVGRGEGGRHLSPGAGQRERGPPNSSLGRYTPPTHIGAGTRSFRAAERRRLAHRPWAGAPGHLLHWT